MTRWARIGRRMSLCAIAAAIGVLACLPAGSAAFAPEKSAKIHPGVQTYTKGAQCTANFVYRANGTTYLGQAAHCAGKGEATDTNGCEADSYPLGTSVRIQGANTHGTIVYSSWIAMHRAKEKNVNACAYNDLTLIKLKPADVNRTNPTLPFYGGPEGVGGAKNGDDVYSYGHSSLRPGTALSPRQGRVLNVQGGGWSYKVKTVPDGVPGDSGSGFLNETGAALGVLSTIEIAPTPTANGVGSVAKEMAYARNHGVPGLRVVNGTKPFHKSLPLALGR
jgi:hypothetical protein